MPRVLRPGIWSTFTVVTFDRTRLSVFPGLFNPLKKKSSALACSGSLQNFPLTNTAKKKKNCYGHLKKNMINMNVKTLKNEEEKCVPAESE